MRRRKSLPKLQRNRRPKPQFRRRPQPEPAPEQKPAPEAAKETIYDPTAWARIMARIAEQTQNITLEFLERNKERPPEFLAYDPAHLGEAMMSLTNRILQAPEQVIDAQLAMWQGYVQIWQTMLTRMQGLPMQDFVKPMSFDKRFMDREWQNNWLFDFMKQLYLLTAQQTESLIKRETAKLEPAAGEETGVFHAANDGCSIADQFLAYQSGSAALDLRKRRREFDQRL